MATKPRPETPEALIERLSHVLPVFAIDWIDEHAADEEGTLTFHGVMITFTDSFRSAHGTLSKAQLRRLGDLVNDCVAIDDDLEKAVATCFLEHLHQIDALKALWPYLSSRARRECHA